jgi:hypothetical protein
MKFNTTEEVDQICYQMRLGDYPRGKNRALVNNLFNGVPPYTDEEAEKNGIEVNVNFLEPTRLSHDARSQFYDAFLKPGNFFTAHCGAGSASRRAERSQIVTSEISKIMKQSIPYMECMRSKFAMDVLHGISPCAFRDDQLWRPEAIGIEDVLLPSGTLLTMDNLPFFAIRKSYTAPQLIKLTRGAMVDKGWKMDVVDACIKWVDQQAAQMLGNTWPEVWAPEKITERIKGDGGFYASDSVPTIDVFDFYFWSDEGKDAGWRRRIILDAWSTPQPGGASANTVMTRRGDDVFQKFKGSFLYNPGDRIFARCREEIINWQFADLSAVAPFRYHSVRSLGFLLYSVCHLQNRLRCKFTESVFEQMLIYFRVKNMEDAQRALKVDMFNRGFIDDTIDFIPAGDRYQVDPNLVQLLLNENSNLIAQNSASYTANPRNSGRSNVEKTKFEVMSEVNAMAGLVSAGLTQAYYYQVPEYREIFRRFTASESRDPEVKKFQARCLARGVPEKILYNCDCWDIEPERVMGAGNRTMEMAIAQQLMQFRNLYDPESQRKILHDVTLAITSDPDRADNLVPLNVGQITDSVHDAQLAAGALMQGLPVAVKSGTNHIEYVDTLLATMAALIQRGARNFDQVMGLQNMANNIAERVALIAMDPNEKARVKTYGDQLGKLMNALKAQAQQLAEKMQAEGGSEGGLDEETKAKIQSMLILAQSKADNTAKAHAQRTAQRQIQFEMEQKRKQEQFQLEMQRKQAEAQQDMQIRDAETAVELRLEAAKAKAEANKPKPKAE